jgi:hypothetical protein
MSIKILILAGPAQLVVHCVAQYNDLPKGSRKKGGVRCEDCGVCKPVPLARFLKKLSWRVAADLLLDQAECLGNILSLEGREETNADVLSISSARNWFLSELSSAGETLVQGGAISQPLLDSLSLECQEVAREDSFFGLAFRGILQEEVLDCARRLSVELSLEQGERDIVHRPGGKCYAFLHSLSVFLCQTKQKVHLEDLDAQIDITYPAYGLREKRCTFAFALLREYARRMKRSRGGSLGLSGARRKLITHFLGRVAEGS